MALSEADRKLVKAMFPNARMDEFDDAGSQPTQVVDNHVSEFTWHSLFQCFFLGFMIGALFLVTRGSWISEITGDRRGRAQRAARAARNN